MSQNVKGSFITNGSVSPTQFSAELVPPSLPPHGAANWMNIATAPLALRLTTGTLQFDGTFKNQLDASNTIKTQKSVDNGETWADQATLNSAQNQAQVVMAQNERWRLATVAMQAGKQIDYEISVQSY
ncbi:MAG: hypothetical protein HYX63_01555 [Gammaproteobacteria bacterium]|nr:hypothetical protein [Gammaproteobacteria bacterium]